MENVFEGDLKPTEIYDLKGSWVSRSTTHELYSGSVMKDVDLKRPIIMEERNTKRILQQLQRDSMFLREHNIMDYSVLLGIYYLKLEFQGKSEDIIEEEVKDGYDDHCTIHSHSANSSHISHLSDIATISRELGGIRARLIDSPGVYYIGIIDTLQEYNWKKRFETWAKTLIQRKDGRGISAVPPDLYQQRFINYMSHVLISQKQYKKALGIASVPFAIEKVFVYAAGRDARSMEIDSKETMTSIARPTSTALNVIRMQQSKSPNLLSRFAYCPSSFHEEDDDAQSVIMADEDPNDIELRQLPFGTSITPDYTFNGEVNGTVIPFAE